MTRPQDKSDAASVAVVGGGLAGLAASAALCERGFRVELFEARHRLGGRAGSFRDSRSGELVDHCQHVSMGCATNLTDFLDRTGSGDCFRRHRRLHFLGPDGARYDFAGSRWLPAPLHLAPALTRLGYVSLVDRLRILRTMARLAKLQVRGEDENGTVGDWLRQEGESDRAIERFWSVVLVSALSETVDRASLVAARKVFVDGFLASRGAYELDVPRTALGEIFDGRVADWLVGRCVTIHRGVRIGQIDGDARRARALVLSDGSRREFDFFVAAVPWRSVRSLFSQSMLEALPSLADVERIKAAPITAVHLWFDRPITRLPHAVLVGRLGQWVFRRGSNYCQVVISASHQLAGRRPEEVKDRICRELEEIWPAARRQTLVGSRVVTHPAAVFSVAPGVDRLRPSQQTPVGNLTLAGDWTATGWPATMEGAVRSGYLAAEAILEEKFPGKQNRLLAPDLPRAYLARRWFGDGSPTGGSIMTGMDPHT